MHLYEYREFRLIAWDITIMRVSDGMLFDEAEKNSIIISTGESKVINLHPKMEKAVQPLFKLGILQGLLRQLET